MAQFRFWTPRLHQDPNNTIHTKVYRKTTHTDQYLHWDSNHFITAKNSVYNTLAHRAKFVSSTPEDLAKELEHLRKALMACQIPQLGSKLTTTTILNTEHNNSRDNNYTEGQPKNSIRENNNNKPSKNISMVIPYIPGLGEKFKRTCNKQGFQVMLQRHKHNQTTSNGTQGQGP